MDESVIDLSRTRYANGYYADSLERGLRFQDLVTRELYQCGIVLVGCASRHYQRVWGENYMKAEIKFDSRCRTRGALWLETEEKSHPDQSVFVQSGIYRDDSLFYVIGDVKGVWMFPTKYLRLLVEKKSFERVGTPTSRAYLMPLKVADRYAIRYFALTSEPF